MPTPGLSLIGFMNDQARVLNHLRHDCVQPPGTSDAQLIRMWRGAQAAVTPAAAPGIANPRNLPPHMLGYIARLMTQAWAIERMGQLQNQQAAAGLGPADFMIVDIEPLLAYQHIVDTARSSSHCSLLSAPPTDDELLSLSLPMNQPSENYTHSPVDDKSTSIIVKSRSHNLRMSNWGIYNAPNGAMLAGAVVVVGLPFVHVTRFGGQCYLHNGYHRVYGAKLAGATYIPCIFRDVATAKDAGIQADGSTFDEHTMRSADAPTIGHFSSAAAQPVDLRLKSRVIHVSWHEYSVADEYD